MNKGYLSYVSMLLSCPHYLTHTTGAETLFQINLIELFNGSKKNSPVQR